MHLHLDPLGGIAGDMFAAALLDAFPDAGGELVACLRAAGLAADVAVRWERVDEVLVGTRFVVDDPRERNRARPATHASAGHGEHVPYARIREQLARLPAGVSARALDIFAHLADAEARVHGTKVDDVVFHEVGAQDSIADVVAAAYLLDRLGVTSASIASLPIGSGRVQTAHGLLPIPSPATALLLTGFATHDDGVAGERVTPTGAAIVKHLAPSARKPSGSITHTGTGWGTKRFPNVPNVLRVLALDVAPALPDVAHGTVTRIEFEVDDQTAEDLAIGLDHVRATPGVLDVVQSALFGKKGRVVTSVRVLCAVEHEDAVARACLSETTSLGVRIDRVRRMELPREQVGDVKRVTRPDGSVTEKREAETVKSVRGHAARRKARAHE